MNKKTPVILITIYRRYYELIENLEHNINLATKEFGVKPDIVIVWASPELGRYHLLQDLLNRGIISKVILRYNENNCDGIYSTTHPESISIRRGLEYIKQNYKEDLHYTILQTADIKIKPGAYQFIKNSFVDGIEAVVFSNGGTGLTRIGLLYTLFFAVGFNEKYWPPISERDNPDILEWQWTKQLLDMDFKNIVTSHNSRDKKFSHNHTSEFNVTFPILPQTASASVNLQYTVYKSTRTIIFEFFRRFFNGNN